MAALSRRSSTVVDSSETLPLLNFPNEVICIVIQHLDIISACYLRQTSKRSASLVGNRRLHAISIITSTEDASSHLRYLQDGQHIFPEFPLEEYPVSAIQASRYGPDR